MPTMLPTVVPSLIIPTLEPTNTPIAPPSLEPTQVLLSPEPTLQPTTLDTEFVKIEQIQKLEENVIPQDRRGYDIVMKLFSNDTSVWKSNTRICPFTFIKGETSESRIDGCSLLVTDKVEMMDTGQSAPAVYVCTDSLHNMRLDTNELLQMGLKEVGADGQNWEYDSANEDLPGISTIISAENIALQGYYDKGFVNPVPSAENDDGTEEIVEENKEKEEEKKYEIKEIQDIVTVQKQLSNVPCELNVNFGVVEGKDNLMFVDKGCQAQFKSNDGISLSCASIEYKYAECEIPLTVQEKENQKIETTELCRPILKEELSSSICACGTNFGMVNPEDADSDSMWASDGCRGIFLSPDNSVVWDCNGDNVERTSCRAGRRRLKNRRKRNLKEMGTSEVNEEKIEKETLEKEADSLNKNYDNGWEFDPDKISGENDQIMSITVASRLAARILPFPDVCGGSDISSATLEKEIKEVEKTGIVDAKKDESGQEKLLPVNAIVNDQMNLRGTPIQRAPIAATAKVKPAPHKVRQHYP